MNILKILFLSAPLTFSCTSPDIDLASINTNVETHEVGLFSSEVTELSRNSAVKVKVRDKEGNIARGSGTLFKLRRHHLVITASHLFMQNPGEIFVSEALIISPQEKVIGTLVYFDEVADIAIFATPNLESRVAAPFNIAPKYKVGDKTVYSGFPGANNLLTLQGVLAGKGYGSDLAMQSFAWGGSSGSGIFNEHGEFVGVLVSIMIGRSYPFTQLVPDVVYVAPGVTIDKKLVLSNLKHFAEVNNDGF